MLYSNSVDKYQLHLIPDIAFMLQIIVPGVAMFRGSQQALQMFPSEQELLPLFISKATVVFPGLSGGNNFVVTTVFDKIT